jgi:hypothetical protein
MLKEQVSYRGRTVIRSSKYNRRSTFVKGFGSRSGQYNPHYANDSTVLRPEVWANESIRLLYEMMVYGGIVHRDFENEIATFGETVHTRYPNEFDAKRKQNDLDTVEDQDAVATGVDVKLNQRVYVSFLLGDGERSKSFKNLFDFYMVPQMQGQARLLDRVVGGQVYQFLSNRAGGLGQISASNASDYMLDVRQTMNDNKVGEQNRWLGLASPSETAMQKVQLFKDASQVGDGGRALREAILGRKHGFNTFLSLNTPSVRGGTTAATTTATASVAAGATLIPVTAITNITPGTYITVAGDYTPLRVLSQGNTGNLDQTVNRPLLRGIASGAVVTPMANAAINQGSPIAAGDTTAGVSDGYPAGWMKEIEIDGTGVPKVGQLVAFRAAGSTVHTAEYCIVSVKAGSNYKIMLDRPLENTLANNDIVNLGPNGDYNFALQREAVALVNRPLELPPEGTGARSARGFFNNMSMRTVITYDGAKQATRVIVDCLLGVKVLQTSRGAVLLG